jgi:hypothetical protein
MKLLKPLAEPVGERGERPGSDFLGSGVKRKRSHLLDFNGTFPVTSSLCRNNLEQRIVFTNFY